MLYKFIFYKFKFDQAISVNPTLTGVDIRLGYGIGYNPTSNSLAAANRGTLANRVYSLKTDYGGDAVKKVIQDFDDLIKKKVDEPDANEGEDPEFTNAVLEKCTPYIRYVYTTLDHFYFTITIHSSSHYKL